MAGETKVESEALRHASRVFANTASEVYSIGAVSEALNNIASALPGSVVGSAAETVASNLEYALRSQCVELEAISENLARSASSYDATDDHNQARFRRMPQ